MFFEFLTSFQNQNTYLENLNAGHIKVLGGPHVARGPEVAQAWHTQCVTHLGNRSEMIIFGSLLTTFWSIFWGSWGSSKNQLEPKTLPPWTSLTKLSLSKSLTHSVQLGKEAGS